MLIIGDIHGCHAELLALLDLAGVGDDEVVVSVGDLVDRGPEPGAVIDFFRHRPGAVALCGNHERKHVRGVLSYSQQVTQAQLGARYADDVAWMATLPYHYETDAVRVVHWGLYPGVPLDDVPADVRAGTTSGDQRLRERYGGRPWWEFDDDPRPAAFGHAVYPEPLVIDGRIFGLDTGACHGMALTGLRLPERRLFTVPAAEDYWSRIKHAWQAPVLRALPWATLSFEQIERKLRSLRDPELGDRVLDEIAAWLAGLRAAVPALRARLDEESARVAAAADPAQALGRHPAARWLTRWRANKLSPTHLGCASPQDLCALAAALGIALPATPL
ncbi:MAG: metallophosphoesterase [Kofleriaceae bacterium]